MTATGIGRVGEIACHSCDLLVHVGRLQHGESASCPRCGCFLTRYRDDAYQRILAFASAGLIFLVLANGYSFLSFSSTGMESVMTLRETPGALWDNGMYAVAMMVTAFIIVIPGAILLLLLVLSSALIQGLYHPWLATIAKTVYLAQNWSMVEVFIIGVIVSLVKIAAMATVVVGASFWAYAAFAICFTAAVANLDRYQCWERIDALGAG
jgi:paraquat-inducible protein A